MLGEAIHLLDLVIGDVLGHNRLAPGWKLVDHRHIQIAIQRQSQRARNRRRRHHQHIGVHSLPGQHEALHHAEAMLLIDNGQPQPMELDVLFEQRMRAHRNLNQTLGNQLLELDLLAARKRSGDQPDRIAQLRKELLKIQVVLVGQYLGRREHGDLVPILDRDHARFRRDDCLAAAHVALQQTVHRPRRRHVLRDLAQHALLRASGLEWQHRLDPLPHVRSQFERDARHQAGRVSLQRQPAFQPEELLEDQPEMPRGPKAVQEAKIGAFRREVYFANGSPAFLQPEPVANARRQPVFHRRKRGQRIVDQRPQDARADLGHRLVDGHDAPHVQRRWPFLVIARERLELGMEHTQFARIVVVLHFSEQGHALPRREDARQVPPVKPLARQNRAGRVREGSLEQSQILAAESGNSRRANLGDHGRHLAGRKLRDGLHVAAVFVAKGEVGDQVLHRAKLLGFEHGGPSRTDAFDIG